MLFVNKAAVQNCVSS